MLLLAPPQSPALRAPRRPHPDGDDPAMLTRWFWRTLRWWRPPHVGSPLHGLPEGCTGSSSAWHPAHRALVDAGEPRLCTGVHLAGAHPLDVGALHHGHSAFSARRRGPGRGSSCPPQLGHQQRHLAHARLVGPFAVAVALCDALGGPFVRLSADALGDFRLDDGPGSRRTLRGSSRRRAAGRTCPGTPTHSRVGHRVAPLKVLVALQEPR